MKPPSATDILGAKKIVYVASSITFASDEYRVFVEEFKNRLRTTSNAFVLEWIAKDSSVMPRDFFMRDLNNVKNCDAMIALVDEPSIGLGMEIEEAIWNKKAILCMHKTGKEVSRLLIGARDAFEFPIREYSAMEDAVSTAAMFVEEQRVLTFA